MAHVRSVCRETGRRLFASRFGRTARHSGGLGPLGTHSLKKGILTKQGTYVMAVFGTGILSNYHLGERPCSAVMLHLPACTKRPPHSFSGSGFKVSLNPMGTRDCMLRPQSTYPCSKPLVSQVHATM